MLPVKRGYIKKKFLGILANAATATKLATPRTIGGVSFDGSANINLSGVNAAGNQSTTGNAATATTATYGITQAVADNTTKIATTAWVRSAMATIATAAGFALSLGGNGYVKFPSWLGGLILQWGYEARGTSAITTVTFPLAFPTSSKCFQQRVNLNSGASVTFTYLNIFTYSNTNFTHQRLSDMDCAWFAIGY